jgi:hypothetical protein
MRAALIIPRGQTHPADERRPNDNAAGHGIRTGAWGHNWNAVRLVDGVSGQALGLESRAAQNRSSCNCSWSSHASQHAPHCRLNAWHDP